MSIVKDRLANGLCPRCGKEAAPYRLCPDHRLEGRLIHFLKRATRLGGLKKERRGRDNYWSIESTEALDAIKWRDVNGNDGRHQPRLRGVPVNVEETLIKILIQKGKPCSIEEIVSARGKLRTTREGSIVANLEAIMDGKRRREEKLRRRAARFYGAAAA